MARTPTHPSATGELIANTKCGVHVESECEPCNVRLPRIMVLSDVQPKDSSGGELLLFRHLVDSKDFDIAVAEPSLPTVFTTRMWRRLRRSRFFDLCKDVEVLCASTQPTVRLLRQVQAFEPDAILTVAHGPAFEQAGEVARHFGIPLVTIFHDWWPDMASPRLAVRRMMERRFHKIAAQSQLCICVSEGMLTELGSPEKAVVILPIPGRPLPLRAISLEQSQFRLGYAGNLCEYGPMVRQLVDQCETTSSIKIELRGTAADWPETYAEKLIKQGVLLPHVRGNAFEQWQQSLNALLCVMSFEPRMSRRMRTSFPSKLIDGLQSGRPLIVWGPPECSAVKWAREHGCCLTITTPSAKNAASEILTFSRDLERQIRMRDAAATAAAVVNTEMIQCGFRRAIRSVLGSRQQQHGDPEA